jgi:hypothetical protein
MMANRLVARALVRSAAAPLVGALATSYGLYTAFSASQIVHPTWRTAVGGILDSLVATVLLQVTVVLVSALYAVVKGHRHDNGAP